MAENVNLDFYRYSQLQPADAVVVPGYSSGEDGPSRLSLMAFDMGRAVCRTIGETTGTEPPLVLVTEQSLPDSPSTGRQIIDRLQVPSNFALIPDFDNNRLLNTNFQVNALAQWMGKRWETDPSYSFHVVSFGFHIPRLRRVMAREGLSPIQYFPVENLMTAHYGEGPRMNDQYKQRYGMEISWLETAERILPEFAQREVHTRALDRIANGKVLNFISRHSLRGRHDDVLPDGTPIHKEPIVRPFANKAKTDQKVGT
jgi:hypothetical protein